VIGGDTLVILLLAIALALAAADQFRAGGRSLLAWAVIILCLIPILGLVALR
jgi:hypothetical protein